MEPKRLHSGVVSENGAILEGGATDGAELRTMKGLFISVLIINYNFAEKQFWNSTKMYGHYSSSDIYSTYGHLAFI